ncbi:hypothetical protein BD414DRAFT_487295 [Trametes punicea]|nr:hypothetical protein BD414DRAFT_487295 [Trametes punicea]
MCPLWLYALTLRMKGSVAAWSARHEAARQSASEPVAKAPHAFPATRAMRRPCAIDGPSLFTQIERICLDDHIVVSRA